MKVFISHSSQDIKIAKELIEIIRSGLNIRSEDIRCTSVNGFRLPIGVNTDEKLKKEIFESEVLVGIVTPSSMDSHYVLFELGARWGAIKPLFPIICSESGFEIMNGPLNSINALDGTISEHVYQFVTDLAQALDLTIEPPAVYSDKIDRFCQLCQENSDIQQDKVSDFDQLISDLKGRKLKIQNVDISLFELFESTLSFFGRGISFFELWQPLMGCLSGKANDKTVDLNDFDTSRIVGELVILDIVYESPALAEVGTKYYLTPIGKDLAKTIRNNA